MAKKNSGKTYISKGERQNVKQSTRSAMKRAVANADRVKFKQDAYWAGKNPWITITNPNKNETNKPFIKVRSNDLYGNPKTRMKDMYVIK